MAWRGARGEVMRVGETGHEGVEELGGGGDGVQVVWEGVAESEAGEGGHDEVEGLVGEGIFGVGEGGYEMAEGEVGEWEGGDEEEGDGVGVW